MQITVKLGNIEPAGRRVRTAELPLGFFVSGLPDKRRLRYRHKSGVLTFERNNVDDFVGLDSTWTDPVPVNVTLVVE